MNCPSCGAVIVDGDLFCSQCGASVDAVQPMYSEPCDGERIRPCDVVGWQCRSPMMVVVAILVSLTLVPFVFQLLLTPPEQYYLLYSVSFNNTLKAVDEALPYIFHYGEMIGAIVLLVGAWLMVYPSDGRLAVGARVAAIGVRVVAETYNLYVIYTAVATVIFISNIRGSGMSSYAGAALVCFLAVIANFLLVSFFRSIAGMLDSMHRHANPNTPFFEKFRGKAVGIVSFVMAALYAVLMISYNAIVNGAMGQVLSFPEPSLLSVVWIALWICFGLFAVKYEFDARNAVEYDEE